MRRAMTTHVVPVGLAAAAALLTGLAVVRTRPAVPARPAPRTPAAEPIPLDLEGLRAAGW